ncbi:Hypothetical_protein [Hexamita inflata]|uniref:Hypothetical_protein n=1 Tax=Hexamita inflata TaxID=28002 RepID=A0AA86P557_9EUKA|nr:Hypothetical protein HINF_LOCUS19849 [Hexamita inflata]
MFRHFIFKSQFSFMASVCERWREKLNESSLHLILLRFRRTFLCREHVHARQDEKNARRANGRSKCAQQRVRIRRCTDRRHGGISALNFGGVSQRFVLSYTPE